MAWTIAGLAAGALLKQFTYETAKYLAQRAFLLALCLGVGPIVIFKGFSEIFRFLQGYAQNYIGQGSYQGGIVQLFGVGAWMGSLLRVPEGISIFLGFCLLSFTLRMIRVK